MLFRSSAPHALLVACAAFAGCSGGGAAVGSTSFTCGDTGAKILCLQACSLGCSTTGCLRSDIAQNEIILLQFSEDVDRASVSTSTIQFRTAGGDMPVGEFFVNGRGVEFVPTLLVSGSQSYFGFLPGETYTLTIPGGPNEQSTLRSTAGRPFGSSVTCTLVASQGIKDYNGVGPEATLVSPSESHWQGAPLTTIIQLDFNEMIDATPFLAATGSSGPVTFTLRRTREAGGGVRECDTSSLPVALPGTARLDFDPARNVSVLTFRSNADLTANTCIEINVTSSVRDIAGNRAQPKVFRFLTESRPLVEVPITEEFLADGQLDRDVSSGTWAGGAGTFGVIGGDGRHGTFRPELGTNLGLINGKRTFSFNTDLTVIPETNTRLGVPLSISDGKFYFDKIVVPADVRVRFTGTRPPQFMACGKIDVLGEIDVAGETLTTLPANTQATGQLGGAGGIFGGSGGQGGDKCFGTGYLPNYDGRVGSNANLIGGHAYATSVSGTGGRGSRLFPLSGNSIDLIFAAPTGVNYTPSAAAGGGGGGMRAEGAIGRVVSNNHPDPILLVPPRLDAMGPPAAGGTALQLFPWPATGGILRASEHFLVGGSGGGGAGSHACLCIAAVNPRVWSPGGGGGGG
ncbi:MAG: hypothetical protein FJ265_06650, partial [Planctomycetes bacterium]|nr:hypothetical protein [Planctomycetota bacterium]